MKKNLLLALGLMLLGQGAASAQLYNNKINIDIDDSDSYNTYTSIYTTDETFQIIGGNNFGSNSASGDIKIVYGIYGKMLQLTSHAPANCNFKAVSLPLTGIKFTDASSSATVSATITAKDPNGVQLAHRNQSNTLKSANDLTLGFSSLTIDEFHFIDPAATYTVEFDIKTTNISEMALKVATNDAKYKDHTETYYKNGKAYTFSSLVTPPNVRRAIPMVAFEIEIEDLSPEKNGKELNPNEHQPNGRAIINLYDVNEKKYVKPISGNYASKPYTFPLENGGYFIDQEYDSSNLYEIGEYNRSSFAPCDPGHTYVAGVASNSAGYRFAVFTFDKGLIKYVDSSGIKNVQPEVVDVAKAYHNNMYITAHVQINTPGVTTGIDEVAAGVAGVKYYNMQGQVSNEPFAGMNVVVTTMTDGSTSTKKVVM